MSPYHTPLYTSSKGRTTVQCTCGWNGTKFKSVTDAAAAWVKHVEQART